MIGVLGGLAIPAWAEPPDARSVLQQAETAIRSLKAVRYQARGEAEGILTASLPKMEGTVTLVAVPGQDVPKIRLDARVVPPRQTQPVTLELASDGKRVSFAEHGQKVYIERELPGGGGLLKSVSPLLILEFTSERPFERELKALSLRHVGVEKVGGVECDVVQVAFAEDGGEARWYIAKNDHLPRQIERIMETPVGRTSVITSLTSLEVSPPVKEEQFRLEKPAGFAELTPLPGYRGGAGLLPVGSDAPDWTLNTADGREVRLQGLRGKVVLLDFWATWCGPCRMAMPGVQRLYEKYKDKPVAIFGVNCWERDPKADPAAFMKKNGFAYPVLLKGDRVAEAYHVSGIPTFYLIGVDGKILLAYAGLSAESERQVVAAIEKQLSSGRSPGPETP
jgi:thiol-disulfide isomerase/thioredoxin